MNKTLKSIIESLLHRNYIGGKHTHEGKLIKYKSNGLTKKEIKEFMKLYKELINNQILLRMKKRTGKNYDWHISINPRKMKDVNEMIQND